MSEKPVSGRFAHRGARVGRGVDPVKSGSSGADELLMRDEREPRSSRRRFLGTMIGAACACGLAATEMATPLARAQGTIAASRRARHRAADR